MPDVQRHARSGGGGLRETAGHILRDLISRLRRAAIVALLLTAACSGSDVARSPVPGSDSWERGAEFATPRTEVAVASIDDRIYVAGGLTDDGASRVVEVYDVRSDSWSSSIPLPVAIHHTGMAGIGGRLYVIGGYPLEGPASADVWSWAPGEERWRAEPDMPTPRGALAVAAYETDAGPRIHAVGGATRFGGDAQLTDAHEIYDPMKRTWARATPFPAPRDHLAAAAIGDEVHVIGGRELSAARNQARLDIFDAGSSTWRRGPDMPTARGGLAATVAGGRLFVFGGEEPSGTFDEAEVYDPARKLWSTADPLPTPRHGLGATVIGDRVYVVGGGPTPGLSVSGANEILIIGD